MLTTQEFKKINAAFATLGVATDADHSAVKEAYKKLVLLHHPDRHGQKEKFREIQEAKEYLDSIYEDPDRLQSFRYFKPSSFELIATSQSIYERIFRDVATFVYEEDDEEKTFYPSETQIEQDPSIFTDILGDFSECLGTYAAAAEILPTVIEQESGDEYLINASNYTLCELVILFDLIRQEKVTLPAPLQYEHQPQSEEHQLLVDAINLERINLSYIAATVEEVENHQRTQSLHQLFKTVTIASPALGIALSTSIELLPASFWVGAFIGCATLTFVMPVIFGLAWLIHNEISEPSCKQIAAQSKDFIKKYFFEFDSGDVKIHNQYFTDLYLMIFEQLFSTSEDKFIFSKTSLEDLEAISLEKTTNTEPTRDPVLYTRKTSPC